MPYQQAIPFAKGSHTSHKAAVAIRRSGTRTEKQRRLLQAFRDAGERGLTIQEAAIVTGLPVQSVCSLRHAAEDCGLLVKSGERIGTFGKSNQVWVAKT